MNASTEVSTYLETYDSVHMYITVITSSLRRKEKGKISKADWLCHVIDISRDLAVSARLKLTRLSPLLLVKVEIYLGN